MINQLTGLLAVVLIFGMVPLVIILHYVTKWKSTRGLSGEEQKMLEDLWESAEQMHARLEALETILDEQPTKWREKE